MEDKLIKLLTGKDLGDITPELCDFTLIEQNAANEAQGLHYSTPSDFTPILGKSVTYIVACVLVNEYYEVLMMQEAKVSCAGKWYLPAGRMEKNESIVDAAVREVYEETGLNVEITTLLAVEIAGGSWFRFVCTGIVIGGELKTPGNADRESLQAKWVTDIQELSLRSNDIIHLIELSRNYHNRNIEKPWHRPILPVIQSHHKNYLRVIAIIRKRVTNTLNVLVSEKNSRHFPTVEIHPARSIHSTLRKFMIEIFGADLPQHRPFGILSVEFNATSEPNPTDGLCISVLVVFRPPLEKTTLIGKCIWHEVTQKLLEEKIGLMLSNKNSTIQLHVVR